MQKHIHILGICGTFMGGLAILARQLGYRVTGSDLNIYPPMSETLAAHQIEILSGYGKSHLQPRPDLVLLGNVCKRGNEDVEYILNENIPYTSGPDWLARSVLQQRHVLAVAGTHGKTTTTSLLTWILTAAGLKPGYLIGGVACNFAATAELGESNYFVVEADEYDTAFFDKRPKFLHYAPRTLILNNLEFDHADIYPDLNAIKTQFHYLVRTVPGNGKILYPQHETNIAEVLARGVWSTTETFAGSTATWKAKLLQADGSEFEVYFKDHACGRVHWNLWGLHNVDNALAAIAAAQDVGVDPVQAIAALGQFQGVKRRLEVAGQVNGITIYDDFAHHPTAIEKTLQALRSRVGNKSIIAILQFGSNTMRMGGHSEADIAAALRQADQVIFFQPERGLNLQHIAQQLKIPAHIYPRVDDMVNYLKYQLQSEDQVLIMSNKGFDGLVGKLLHALTSA